jgi:putative ABC transport system permease protein
MYQFKTAFRSLFRARVFSAINISGLALGMAVFLLIMQFVASEWGANRFHQNYARLYRVLSKEGDNAEYYLPPGYGPAASTLPGLESVVRMADGIGAGVIGYRANESDNRVFGEEAMIYVEGNFLEVFSFPLLSGKTDLRAPKTLALSATMARKLTGDVHALGKRVTISNQFGNTDYDVVAVFADAPESSDIRPEVLLSIHTLESPANRDGNDWADPNTLSNGFVTIYALLKPQSRSADVEKTLTDFARRSAPEASGTAIVLQPMKHLHLAPGFGYPYQTFGSLGLVTMLLGIALVILGIAWVNYINLSTAQALRRAREAGVRKVLGASQSQIAGQFLRETLVITLVSLVLALIIVRICQPLFNDFTGKTLSLSTLNQGWFWAMAGALILTGSFLSGSYIAFILGRFKPVNILKGQSQGVVKRSYVRNGLVVFQFAVSILFMVATITLFRQLDFMKSGSLGFRIDQHLVVQGPTVSSEDQAARNKTFKQQLAALPFVKQVAASNNIPGRGYNFSTVGITRLVPQAGDEKKNYSMFIADQNFFSVFDIPLIAGRFFTEQEADASWNNDRKVLLNEKAARSLGFEPASSAVGQRIRWGEAFEVIGVVKDYHHLSMHRPIEPVIYLGSVSYSFFTVRTEMKDLPKKIATIEQLYKNAFPGNPWSYTFADDAYDAQYKREQDLGKVFVASALIAIFIACLGLFGLAAFSAQQRVKEIGIRKVLGADVTDITRLLSQDFLRLVAVAILVAVPLAWWGLHKWLQDFAYRTDIEWWFFVVAGLAAIVIALATVGIHAIRAANGNPVQALRAE